MMLMHNIRFVGGAMDGKTGRDTTPPERVTYTAPGGGPADVYVQSMPDPDGTLVYRKR